ncbi:MAG: ribosome maturation factor RimP, partial [Aestuariivirgaceae bacterium]
RWAGHEAKIDMLVPQAGRRRFRGILGGFVDGEVRLFVDEPSGGEKVPVGLPFAGIAEAKLVLTDELLADARKRRQGTVAMADGSDWENRPGIEIQDGDDNG